MIKEFFGCKEDYYKDLLENQKERIEIYKKGYYAANKSYSQLLDITKDLLISIGDGNIDKNDIIKIIENATQLDVPKKVIDTIERDTNEN